MRLLYAEDEKNLSKAVTTILEQNNYSVDAVYNGSDALDYALSGEYDAIILDVMMPVMDGMAALRAMRERGVSTPVILLTARSTVDDKVDGLDSGANDYLTKPFSVKELLARLRALTRSTGAHNDSVLSFGNITLDTASFRLAGPKGDFRLANKEYQMMEMLMHRPGAVVSSDRLFDTIWGLESDTEQNVVWVYISFLRKKLASVGADIQIKAQRNAGYVLEKIQ